MESEQPTAVKDLSSVQETASTETSIETEKLIGSIGALSTDKMKTTPQNPTEAAVEMKAKNESVQGVQVNESAEVVEGPLKEQAVMECESLAAAVQEMDCEAQQAASSGDSEASPAATENPLPTATPPVQPAPVVSLEPTTKSSDSQPASTIPATGLSLLASYGSDADDSDVEEVVTQNHGSDNEVVEVPVTGTATSSTAYRRSVVAVSSGEESSKSSSSSDSDSESEGEYLTVLRKKIEKRINTEPCDEDDDDFEEDGATGDRSRRRQPPKVRGEMLLDELPPIHQLEITVPEDECVELGKVHSIVDQLVLVSVLPNSMLFDLDTVLFLEKGRKVLGEVFDVLGQVSDPLYCVRFNTNQQILDKGITIGDVVYCAPKTEHTQFVILSKLMQVKGSDASWEHDVEPPSRYIDYSDDDEEREARQEQRKRRQRDRTNSTDSVDTVTSVATTATETSVAAPPPRQRGRRGQRESFRRDQRNSMPSNYQNQNQNQNHPTDQQYNYHPSYNPGSWHSNYYHNYHQPPNNFNMAPQQRMPFPVPNYGYGMPYAMPPMMPMAPPPHPHHMYPPPPPFAAPPPPHQNSHPHQGQPPN
ncbi:hypothetical protein KR009_003528 [Drosophila setifemur]|nr:hypothetical protein KR009_003528 [Drosophila setifemur]